jgi:hypothetical protein
MGLRPLREKDWIEVDSHRELELEQKANLVSAKRSVVVATLPSSSAAQAELEELVTENIATFHPNLTSTQIDDPDPIVRTGRSIQEDLCIMQPDGDRWLLTAACVCFPSRWALTEKIGRDLTAIHAPVPGYDTDLRAPVDAFFSRLRPDQPKWRLNWTILDTDELHLPTESAHRRNDLVAGLGELTFRVERQTLRSLEQTGAVVFTIRNYTAPLALLCENETTRLALLATLESVSPEVASYKGWTPLLRSLLTWLREFSG